MDIVDKYKNKLFSDHIVIVGKTEHKLNDVCDGILFFSGCLYMKSGCSNCLYYKNLCSNNSIKHSCASVLLYSLFDEFLDMRVNGSTDAYELHKGIREMILNHGATITKKEIDEIINRSGFPPSVCLWCKEKTCLPHMY